MFIKRLLLNPALILSLIVLPLWTFPLVAAADCPTPGNPSSQVLTGVGQTPNNCSDSGVTGTAAVAVNILSWVAGIVTVVMIIFSGIKYTTSGGDSQKVSSAKNSLIYALVGLVIVALTQTLVHFVLNN